MKAAQASTIGTAQAMSAMGWMARRLLPILCMGLIPLSANSASAALPIPMSLFSLNLHGYHPTDEAPRYVEDRSGKVELSDSDIFFFTLDELDRGHRRRLDRLASDIRSLLPEVIFFQEVGAGSPNSDRSCDAFYRQNAGDSFETNSALRIANRLIQNGAPYRIGLACRGNIGWQTDAKTFHDYRVVKSEGGRKSVVFDFDSNPYPGGMIVEGLAVLARDPWVLEENLPISVPINAKGDRVFAQLVILSYRPTGTPADAQTPWVVALNHHGGHKVAHFEQSVALRKALAEFIANRRKTRSGFSGLIVAGDFNSYLYRPGSKASEISSIPWEITKPGLYDFRSSSNGSAGPQLKQALWELNQNSKYKDWASIRDSNEALNRIDAAVNSFLTLQRMPELDLAGGLALREAFESASEPGRCRPTSVIDSGCVHPERIDLAFMSSGITAEEGYIAYPKNNWSSLQSLTDHPGLMVRLGISP